MSFILVLGIILVVLPLVLIEGFAHAILFSFLRDDDDAKAILNLALGVLLFGIVLIVIHFATNAAA